MSQPNPTDHPPKEPPARLSRLKVSGFRSIREIDLELGDLTVLIGANGSGKSNFVGFFNMMSSMLSERLQLYIQQKGAASSILHYGPKVTPEMKAQLTFTDKDDRSVYDFRLGFAAPDRLIFVAEQFDLYIDGKPGPIRMTMGSGHTETNLHQTDPQSGSELQSLLAGFLLKRLQELRVYHFHDTSETARIRLAQDVGDNRALRNTGDNLAAFLYMLQQSFPPHYERILSTVRLAVPYIRDLVLEPDRLGQGKIQLRWRDQAPDHEFGAHQLSDGSLRAIALITALMQPEELLPALIAIDEPELGLHPSVVGTVAQLIQAVSRKRQVIVATQSSRMIAAFAPEDVVVVERTTDQQGRGESTFQRLSREALGAWLDDYDLGQLYDMNVTGGGPQS